mgnify:FL=1
MSSKKTTIDETFPDRLRELIELKLGVTQGEFAKKIGITTGYVSMVVTGKRGPSAEMIAGIFVNYSEYLPWLLNQPSGNAEKMVKSHRKSAKDEKKRRFDILNQAEEWLADEVGKNPKKEIWFEVEFEKAFEEFKEWKEEKERAATEEAYATSRKVA